MQGFANPSFVMTSTNIYCGNHALLLMGAVMALLAVPLYQPLPIKFDCIVGVIPKEGLARPIGMTTTKILKDLFL